MQIQSKRNWRKRSLVVAALSTVLRGQPGRNPVDNDDTTRHLSGRSVRVSAVNLRQAFRLRHACDGFDGGQAGLAVEIERAQNLGRRPYRAENAVAFPLLWCLFTAMNESVVVQDPEILSGTPVFAGTCVPVRNLLDYVEGGYTPDEFLDDFPGVTKAQVVAFLEQASAKLLVAA
jgi:uncharacterized protein (DUF433 family)